MLNKTNIPSAIVKDVTQYCNELIKIHSNNLLSIVLYGNAADELFYQKGFPINLLLIFDSVTLPTLNKSLKLIASGQKKNIVAPLFFTEEHIKSSTDTFPVEFLEIQDSHLLLFGHDFFTDLEIETCNLRLQTEEQIKSLIIKIRQSYLEIGLKKRGVERLILESFDSLIPILKATLRLSNNQIVRDKEGVITQAASVIGFSASVLLDVYFDSTRDERIGGKKAESFLREYLLQLEHISEYIDKTDFENE